MAEMTARQASAAQPPAPGKAAPAGSSPLPKMEYTGSDAAGSHKIEDYIELEGPFTAFFHRLFKRRPITRDNLAPYPWFIGGIHRACRMLDMADPWEVAALFIAPLLFWFGMILHSRLSVHLYIQGFYLIFLGCYVGFFWTLWVFLDRRLDHADLTRGRQMLAASRDAREARYARRRALNRTADARKEAMKEAALRGRARRSHPDKDDNSPAPPTAHAPTAREPVPEEWLDPG